MTKKWTKRSIALLAAHVVVLSILLFPTAMELFRWDFHTWSAEEVSFAPSHLKDGSFWNGELLSGRVRYLIFLGPLTIRSVLK